MVFFIKTDFWFERASEIIKEIPTKERIICQAVLNEIITLIGMKSDVKKIAKKSIQLFKRYLYNL